MTKRKPGVFTESINAIRAVVDFSAAPDEVVKSCKAAIRALIESAPSYTQEDVKRLVEAIREMMMWGVEFDDERIKYISVQVDRGDIKEVQEALVPFEGGEK